MESERGEREEEMLKEGKWSGREKMKGGREGKREGRRKGGRERGREKGREREGRKGGREGDAMRVMIVVPCPAATLRKWTQHRKKRERRMVLKSCARASHEKENYRLRGSEMRRGERRALPSR